MTPFSSRHIGPSQSDQQKMAATLGCSSPDHLIGQTLPPNIRLNRALDLPAAATEHAALAELRAIASSNRPLRSHLGMGYYGTITPAVIRRNVLENPGWYTAYTPYQAEIAQGRLEALLNFQTMVTDLTGLDIANASLLDEATAAAEAISLCYALRKNPQVNTVLVSRFCHPQTIDVVHTRCAPLGIHPRLVDETDPNDLAHPAFAALLQYPRTDGSLVDLEPLIRSLHDAGCLAIIATDLLACTILRPPGPLGADVAVGSAQRFGVPIGFGGPHAAFMATRDTFKRHLPGRIVGVSRDAHGNPAYRLALQTREQHIRREKATSNICTAQVLLAVMASLYAAYHGPSGLSRIARHVHHLAKALALGLQKLGFNTGPHPFFDTLRVNTGKYPARDIVAAGESLGLNFRALDDHCVAIALDETTDDIAPILAAFNKRNTPPFTTADLLAQTDDAPPTALARDTAFLTHPVFNSHHTETEMLRYIRRLESRDLSLTTSMIPLGSCTMKLNATSEMLPVTWAEFADPHPFAPHSQTAGYARIIEDLQSWLAEITGLPAVSLQPNAGSQGEYAGLLAIRAYHLDRGQPQRTTCLIPTSAHGTNPASAVMAGFRVVPVRCRENGDIDMGDLRAKATAHAPDLGALMVTYPSTHGVFEETIREICDLIHANGALVYLDGANMNAQVGLCRPGDFGADVCHLNLHKTFCIPHGGGGPGVGPICAGQHLAPFLPGLPGTRGEPSGAVSAAPYGSASILVIPWIYIRMMGPEGLADATRAAILNANYIAHRLAPYFPVLFKGTGGRVAHECVLDLRDWKTKAGIEVEDVAKRLMDYGFHAPTVSWPVPGTVMIEPTESESLAELDRFCDAMIDIHAEMSAVANGRLDRTNNPLKNAPHTAAAIAADNWDHPYSRTQAAYPAPWLRDHKFWPAVGRIDNVYGDRNPICTCPSLDDPSLNP